MQTKNSSAKGRSALSGKHRKIHLKEAGRVDRIIKKMSKGGAKKLHVLADFDRTMTLAFVDGTPTPSITAILRDHNYLTPDYPAKAKALYAHYSNIERNPSVDKNAKKKLMDEWWRAHFELLKKSGLSKSDIERAMSSGVVQFRPGALEFMDRLQQENIPLVLMSASGLGEDSIATRLRQEGHLLENVYIIGNAFIWDENDKAVGVREPIVTGMNKDETLIQNFPAYKVVKDKPNVILLGDNIGDVGMVHGFDYENLLKIGFLNDDPAGKLIPEFEKNYDALILDDGPFDYINNILEQIIK